jgi:hypothetical protein
MDRDVKQLVNLLPNFFTESKRVRESLKQHKYARLSYASYDFGSPDKVKKLFSELPELRSFQLDKKLSTPENSVYYNLMTREVVVSFRGTSNLKDGKDDFMILIGKESLSRRYKQSLLLMEKVIKKYDNFHVVSTGHSLGGGISSFVSNHFGIESHNFNGAESIHGALHNDNINVFNYRTHYDLASVANLLEKNKAHIQVQTRISNVQNVEGVHRLNNFFDKNAVRVVESNGDTFFESNKSTSIHEKMGYLGFVVDAGFAISDIRSGVKSKDSVLKIVDTVVNDVMSPSVARLAMDSPDGTHIMRYIEDVAIAEVRHHEKRTFTELLDHAKEAFPKGISDGSGYMAQDIDHDSFKKDVVYKQVMGDPYANKPEELKIDFHWNRK